jgi:hypothetical protein
MLLEAEQEQLLAEMVEGARGTERSEHEWFFMEAEEGEAILAGPGTTKAVSTDVRMLERAGLILRHIAMGLVPPLTS